MKLRLPFLFIFLSTILNAQVYNYYYGNLHSHTGFSDGNQDSTSSNVSTPAGSFAYAKLSQNFNFLGISEHNHYSSNNSPGFKIQSWPIGVSQANSANQDGTFLCMYGMEWGVSSNYYGHVLVYGFPQLIGWETGNYEVFNAKGDYNGLFTKIKNQPGAFCMLAHPYYSDFSTAQSSSSSLLNSPYNAAWDSAIVGTPLRNGVYNTTSTSYDVYPAGNYFDYYIKILAKGYHLGISYDHDNHNTTFGRNNAGRVVMLATSLSRANFFDAMQKMRFYASDDWNAKISFSMNNNVMGSILSGTADPAFTVIHNDVDGEMADSIKIWRGISNNFALPSVVSITKQNNTASYTDVDMTHGPEYYYFAEIKQADGQWIVTSPIWYTNTAPVSVKENEMKLEMSFFPNPVSQKLSLSTSECDDYKVSILDISGRIIYSAAFFDKSHLIDLNHIPGGIYSLKLENKKHSVLKKLVIE
jgi:hypothetical protein